MMGDHLTQEVSVDIVVRAGISHPEKHSLRNLMKALQILALCRFCILQETAAVQGVRHICDAFRLFCNNIFCDLLQGKPGGVPEKVFGHFDGRPVVGIIWTMKLWEMLSVRETSVMPEIIVSRICR